MIIKPGIVGLSLAIFVCAFFVIAINSNIHGYVDWYRLWKTGVKMQAVITRREPENHRACYYKYTVAGHEYESVDSCESVVGAPISITYLPTNPSFATSKSPREEFVGMVISPLTMSVLAGTIGFLSTGFGRGFRR